VWYISRMNMARDKVFWIGHPVAAIAAVDPHVAEAALALIEVEYEVLPPVMTLDDALRPGAPVLHAHNFTKGVEPKPRAPSNIGARTVLGRGDVARGFAESDVIVERRLTIDVAHQGYIEPNAVVAQVEPGGMTTVWASTQGSFTLEIQLAAILGIPQSRLKVVPLEIGGGFGGKIYAHIEPAAVVLARKSGRPVKIVLSREEVMVGTGPASAARIDVKVGAARDGRLKAIQARFYFDAGGFPGVSTTLQMQACANPYQCDNLDLEGYDVVTTKPRGEAYRGPGGPQVAFAMEQAMDEVAQRLDLDPLAFRRLNASVTGSPMVIGTPFPTIGLTTILDRVARHSCWTDKLADGRNPRGRGMALGYWRGTSMTSACHVALSGDGRLMVTMGAVDISGTRTSMAQIAAEEFGFDIADVHVQMGDTKSVGFTQLSAGSRVTRTMAAAVHEACQDAIAQLKTRAAAQLQCTPADIVYAEREFRVNRPGGASIPLAVLARATMLDGAIVGRGVSTRLPLGVEFGAHVCDLEVDPGTGQVTILRYTAFQDVGRAINPPSVEGQIEGSVAQGLGWALTEGFDYDATGRLRNANLLDYRIPTALDVPPIETVIIETAVPGVPYGLRGVGEVPIVPPGAAVANAIARATGKRQAAMPMTPERVLRSLRGERFGKV
ncbi:MAG: molybdopterin-dependent oxidoreductase, partial [Alphaproteobacteria bacterium]|nr:molybdopterin-dependent oxidoreductase [Alphaproteobacteria bacterium]